MREYLIHARGIYDSALERVTAVDGMRVRDGIIAQIADFAALRARHPDLPVLGCPDGWLFPGLINTHVHLEFSATDRARLDYLEGTPGTRLLTAAHHAGQLLRSGVTTARDAGKVLASIAQYHAQTEVPLAFIMGGETIVKITGNGKGGRNQELALAAAPDIAGLPNVAIFSVGSDGTDGPTDAAGGYVDAQTAERLEQEGIKIEKVLMDNDAYHALERVNGLIITGPTGTNVNDLSVLLINPAGN